VHRQIERYGGGYGERYAPHLPCASVGHPLELCTASAADAINYAVDGLDKFNTEKEVAQYLRKAFVDKVCHAKRTTRASTGRQRARAATPQSACDAHTPHCRAAAVGDSRVRGELPAALLTRYRPGGMGVAPLSLWVGVRDGVGVEFGALGCPHRGPGRDPRL